MNNIFEGAKFGDKFLTRGGEIAIFWCISDANEYSLISDITERILVKRQDGLDIDFDESFMDEQDYLNTDIVSRYQEPIDEDKLDELALTEYDEEWAIGLDKDEYSLSHETKLQIKAFKEGYRKAMKE